jgi:hypothetical protein
MWMEKHNQTSFRQRLPYWFHLGIIKPLSNRFSPHYNAFEVWERGDLLDSLQQSVDGNVRHQRKQTEAIETSDAGLTFSLYFR